MFALEVETELTFVIVCASMSIEPDIVPPARGRKGPPVSVLLAIPESLMTLSETNDTILFNVPVLVLLTMLSAEREFTAPLRDPTFVILFVPIAIAPDIVPPARGRKGPPVSVLLAIPESWITLSETNDTILFNVPVLVLLTILSTVLEFVGPINEAFE
jgi:hypothetical protein